ncbi:MAG: hypothetical protein JWR15_3464 [Prosthecobacter sp.]|nr:hypothetical protein [Prosthecobacter sp.]
MDQNAKALLDEKLVTGEITTDEYREAVQRLIAPRAVVTAPEIVGAIMSSPPPLPASRTWSPLAASKDEPFAISQHSFRFLVLIAGCAGVLGIVAGLVYGSSLPPEIDEYLSKSTGVQSTGFTVFSAVVLFAFIPAYIWSLIGLWRFRSSARRLLVIAMLVGYVIALFSPASVVSGLELVLFDTGAIATACVLTLAYWGPAKQWFT